MKIILVTQAKAMLICVTVAFFLLAPLLVLLITETSSDNGIQILQHAQSTAEQDPDHLQFQQFLSEFNRDYRGDSGEYQKRFGIFKDNLRYVSKMNSYNLSYTLGVTMFSDLTDEEFIEQYASKELDKGAYLGDLEAEEVPYMRSQMETDTQRRQLKFLQKEENANERFQREFERLKYRNVQDGKKRYQYPVDEIDGLGMSIGDYEFIDHKLIHCPMVDWVKQGKVLGKVKNQKKCGSCWAHNTVAAVENLYARYNEIDDPEEIPSLSEQQLVDCDTFPNIGCFGGEAKYAFNYTKNHGLTGSDFYQYLDRQEECRYNPMDDLYDDMNKKMPKTPILFQIDDFKVYDHVTRRDLEKLSCEGVVAVPMRLNKCIKHYISGIIDDSDGLCGCSQIGAPNHAVALVGFGQANEIVDSTVDEGWRQVEGYSGTKCDRYWLLRNSWTHRWGEGGYFRLCRDDDRLRDGTCFIRHNAVLPVMNKRYYYSRDI